MVLRLLLVLSSAVTFLSVGCAEAGPSAIEVEQIVDERVATAIASVPTVTPAPLVSTATPFVVSFPDTPTPAPTVTPQPTPTRIRIRTATPQPIEDFNRLFLDNEFAVFRIETDTSLGTGWLIEPGLILTNEHVISGSDVVTVRQSELEPFTARVVASDEQRDIALLEFDINDPNLDFRARVMTTGDVSILNIASSLMAMGYSGGLAPRDDGSIGPATANIGVLSSIILLAVTNYANLVIDAPVDPGDSGGPILNADGEVVGMVRAVQERTFSGQRVVGTFLAIHIDEIRDALPNLKRGISR